MLKKGFSTRKIAKKLNCHHFTVSSVTKLKLETGFTERKIVIGRKRVITTVKERYLKRLCLQNHHASEPHSKVKLENTCGVSTLDGVRTVQRRRTECGLRTYRQKKKRLLTQKMKKKRLIWVIKICCIDESSMGHCNFLG